jgi:hypothetical protein
MVTILLLCSSLEYHLAYLNQTASPDSTHKCVYDLQYFLLAPAYVILQAESADSTPESVFMTVPTGDYTVHVYV